MKLVEQIKKSRVLKKASFGCLRNCYVLNITRGCFFQCAYCYARGYPGAPVREVHLYVNLPDRLSAELDNPRRRCRVNWISFNSASDCFQPHPRILETSFRTMQLLLKRGIGFSFLTKGWIPDSFMQLFTGHRDLITARIGMVSASEHYRKIFEPESATIPERLDNLERLKKAGIKTSVRIDPIIPFYTDDANTISNLIMAINKRGVNTASLSYLHLRPAVLEQLKRELPSSLFHLLNSSFRSQKWDIVGTSTRSKLIPAVIRQKGYRRFRAAGEKMGIQTLICSCKNPDLTAQQCAAAPINSTPQEGPVFREKQLCFSDVH